jgi:riboflavin synthase
MFTGIVEEVGRVASLEATRLSIACEVVRRDAEMGDSIAVSGTCLTVVGNDGASLAFDLSKETLARTALRRLRAGARVNLERPVTLAARLGGHLVQGHVDGVGEVEAVVRDATGGAILTVGVPADLSRYVVEKGSIAIDGVSLTAAAVDGSSVSIALIPHTLAATTLGEARVGDPVNLEVDVIAKYVERLMEGHLR